MKKNSKFAGFYMGLIFFLMYLGEVYGIFPEMVSGADP